MDFKKPYDSKEFIDFLGDFLPDDFEHTSELININDLSFKPDRIKKVKLIGQVPSIEDLRVYEIEHKSESDPRVTLSRETFRLMSNYGVKKALAIFISRNSHNYRFSLATIELKLEGSRVTKDYSNPRRYSFFLGPDAKIHTPAKYLITNGRIKDLKDLQNRFSIEVVTKEFFSELSNWYFWALKNIECPKNVEEEQNGKNIFTIRLITRLIFIWFMKHKGLIPENLFNSEYLEKILKDLSRKETTYYKAILQNLFFATLNTPIKDRDFRADKNYHGKNEDFMNHNVYRYHKLFINPEDMKNIFNSIPFLNGGLFECFDRIEDKGKYIRIDGFSDREDSQLNVPNSLFFSEEHLVDLRNDYGPEEKYKKCKVGGIIDLLQTYNFTIDESTPVDVEIALDPELLGRVFENLLASYNPDTAATARKSTGSYYTPREIVDYMVTQSLKEYFKTYFPNIENIDDKLNNLLSYDFDENRFNNSETDTLINSINNLKIIDPAVGSGAFPMGILQKLVLVLSKLDSHNEKWKNQQIKSIEENITDIILKKELIEKIEDNFKKNELDYGRKLYLIQNSIYGVDIQPIATQIAKLRFFISLLVDEKIDREDGNYGTEPLPNLELKFISANSLIGLNLKGQLDLKDQRLPELEEDLKRVRKIYFRTSDVKQKEKLRKEDKELRDKISVLLKDCFASEDTKKIAEWNPYNSNKSADWFDTEWMFGVKDGFDIVIGNPPYITYKGKEVVDISDAEVKQLISLYPNSAEYKVNSYALFTERGVNLLNIGGTLSYIIPSTILQNEYLKKIRKYLITKYHISQIVSFANKVFEAVTDSIILKVNNNHSGELRTIAIRKNDLDFSNSDDLKIYNPEKWNDEANDFVINLKTNAGEDKLLEKIELNASFVDDFLEVNIGIKRANAPIIERPKSGYKPFVVGRDINKFELKFPETYILFDTSLFHTTIDEGIFKQKEKILVRKTGNILIAFYDTEKYYSDQSIYNLYPKNGKAINLKVVTGLLNSLILEYYFNKKMITNPDVFPYIKGIHLKKLPLKFPKDKSEEKKFETAVVNIIEGKKENEDTSGFEKQLNEMVYKLYDLTEKEIKIIENKK